MPVQYASNIVLTLLILSVHRVSLGLSYRCGANSREQQTVTRVLYDDPSPNPCQQLQREKEGNETRSDAVQYLFDTTPRAADTEDEEEDDAEGESSTDDGDTRHITAEEEESGSMLTPPSAQTRHLFSPAASNTTPRNLQNSGSPGIQYQSIPVSNPGGSPRLQGPPGAIPELPMNSEPDQQCKYPSLPLPTSIPESIRSDVNPLFNDGEAKGDSSCLLISPQRMTADKTSVQRCPPSESSAGDAVGLYAAAAIAQEFANAPNDRSIVARLQEALSRTTTASALSASGGVGRGRLSARESLTGAVPQRSVSCGSGSGTHLYGQGNRSATSCKPRSAFGSTLGPSAQNQGKRSQLVSLQKLKKADLVIKEMPEMAEMTRHMPSMNSVSETEQLGYEDPVPQTPAESNLDQTSSAMDGTGGSRFNSRQISSSLAKDGGESTDRVGVRFLTCITTALLNRTLLFPSQHY